MPTGIITGMWTMKAKNNLNLFVVKKDRPSLFGRASYWLKYIKLDWNSVKFLQTGKSTEDNFRELLQK